jgi:hypothetical protein
VLACRLNIKSANYKANTKSQIPNKNNTYTQKTPNKQNKKYDKVKHYKNVLGQSPKKY